MRKPTKTSVKKKLDKAFSLFIRNIGKCERCGKTSNLQCAHIFSRSKLSVRWDKDNALCLCGGCHLFWAHKNPIEFYEFVKNKLGEDKFNQLKTKALIIHKYTLAELENLLTGLAINIKDENGQV